MKLARMVDGHHTQHQGVTHTLKHYLNPSEHWDDLATEVAPELQPTAVLDMLGPQRVEPHRQWSHPNAALVAAWDQLGLVHRGGYYFIIAREAEPLGAPPAAPWVRVRAGHHAAHIGRGIVVIVADRDREIRTAFRDNRFAFKPGVSVPRDPASIAIRVRQAAQQAPRLLSRLWGDDA